MADPAGCLGRTLPAEILSPGISASGSFSTLFQLFSNSTCFFLRPTSEFSIAALTISLTESLTLEVEGPGASFSLELIGMNWKKLEKLNLFKKNLFYSIPYLCA